MKNIALFLISFHMQHFNFTQLQPSHSSLMFCCKVTNHQDFNGGNQKAVCGDAILLMWSTAAALSLNTCMGYCYTFFTIVTVGPVASHY